MIMIYINGRGIKPETTKPLHSEMLKDKKIYEKKDILSVGYHLEDIPKGIVGEPSKVLEETLEFMDAINQGVDLMALIELADLYGAMESYLQKHHPTISMDALKSMSDVTRRAFASGRRP